MSITQHEGGEMLKAHTDYSSEVIWMQLQGNIVLLGVMNAALMEKHKNTCV